MKVLYPLRIANFFALAGQAVVERTVVAGLGGRGASLRLVACGDPEEQRRLASWAASLDVAGTVEAVPLDRADPTEEIAAADWLLLHSLPLGECRHWLAQGRVVGRLPTLQYVHSLLLAPFEIAMWSDLWRGWDGTPPARLVAPSHGAAARVRMLRRLAEARGSRLPDVAVIPHGVDLARIRSGRRDVGRRLLGIDPSDLVMLSIGRISPEKAAYHELLLAFEAATTDRGGAPATLVVAGAVAGVDRPYRRSLEALSARLGIDRRVHFVEALDEHDKPDVLAAADVFVSPAVNPQESFGLAVLEAMAAGLPVVATDWNGYRELLPPAYAPHRVPTLAGREIAGSVDWTSASEACSLRFPPLVAELRRMLGDDALRRRLGGEGARHAEGYSWDRAVADLVTLADAQTSGASEPRDDAADGAVLADRAVTMVSGMATVELDDRLRFVLVRGGRTRSGEALRLAAGLLASHDLRRRMGEPGEGLVGRLADRARAVRALRGDPFGLGRRRLRRGMTVLMEVCAARGDEGAAVGELRSAPGLSALAADWLLLRMVGCGVLDLAGAGASA